MSLSSRLLEANLSHFQFRLFVTLWSLATPDGVVEQPMDTLGRLARAKSRNTVREAVRALEAKGLLETCRKKRGRGFHAGNKYQLLCPLQEPSLCPATEASTDRAVSNYDYLVNKSLVPNSHISQSSYENIKIEKISEESMNRKWREEQEADNTIGGIGKLDSEDTPTKGVPRNKPSTRGKRPQEHWTVWDVAAEFSYLVGRRYPWLPGTVNVNSLSGALQQMRTKNQTTALVELELLKMFVADDNNFKNIGNEAPHLYKVYLAMFRTHMNKARQNLGLNLLGDMSQQDAPENQEVLYASDGTVFHDTLMGRNALERYEKKLNA
jgi:hypothetical protein